MKTNLEVVRFVKEHDNWRELLAAEPYCLKITEDDGYILLKYNQLSSDFNNEIVRECRGLILGADYTPVCVPFYKFGNYGESYCPEIDWSTARVQEKIDGSLMKLFYDNRQWRLATNGTIDAYKAELQSSALLSVGQGFRTFGELFDEAAKNSGLDYSRLDPANTYMFELVSPYNRVVIPYEKTEIYHIGTRNNATLEELNVDVGVRKPREFNISTLSDCIAAANELPYDKEGYVVVDGNWNRVKIKSPKYVLAHHRRANGNISVKDLIEVLRTNETAEFLIYCPEYSDALNKVKEDVDAVIARINNGIERLKETDALSQKDFALLVKGDKDSAFYFLWRKNHEITPEAFLWKQTNEKIERILENV